MLEVIWGELESEKGFIQKIFETNSSFYTK